MATRAQNTKRSRATRDNSKILGFIFVGVAFVFGVWISKGGEKTEASQTVYQPQVVGQFDTVKVPVPIAPVPVGKTLRDVQFKYIKYPNHQVPTEALTDLTPYLNSTVVTALPANLPIFKANLSKTAGVSNPIIERIPEGMRAITVRVDATAAVEGWAAAGAIVDVMLVGQERSMIIAEQVKILSAERSMDPIQGQTPNSIPSTVTLLVTQEQALAINTAANNGKIAFALRSLNDSGEWESRVFAKDRLAGERSSELKAQAKIEGAIKLDNGKYLSLVDGEWIESMTPPSRLRGITGSELKEKN